MPSVSARTKGNTESGVGYVKHNAIAGLSFASFASLEAHLVQWMVEADRRIHGTTYEQPAARFERDERAALRPLPSPALRVRRRRLQRRVATDCFVDVDTIRHSIPHALVRRTVEVRSASSPAISVTVPASSSSEGPGESPTYSMAT